jgi:hypothetical protein
LKDSLGKSDFMEQREIDFIADDLWKDELEFRKDPKNIQIVQWESEFYKELNMLGYNFSWNMQFGSSTFSEKDGGIIPIFIKHLDKTDDEGIRSDYLICLGVKGFHDATEYVLNEYEKSLSPVGDGRIRNAAAQTIGRIQDPRYIDRYLNLLDVRKVVLETSYIIRLLVEMKIEEAIPYLVKLLDKENRIQGNYYGTLLEDCKYHVSQEAIKALAQYKNPEHIKHIEIFLAPEKISWIRYPDTKDGRYLLKKTYKEYKKIAEKAIRKMSGNLITR